MLISYIVTLVVGMLAAIFLGAVLSPLFNTLGIIGAYPYAAAIILAAFFAAAYFFVQRARSSNGYNAVVRDYPDGGYALVGDLRHIFCSERGFYILVFASALLAWLVSVIDAAVTVGDVSGPIGNLTLPFLALVYLPLLLAVYPRTTGAVAASIWLYAVNAALVCAIYTAILAAARRVWYKKHMELHGKRKT